MALGGRPRLASVTQSEASLTVTILDPEVGNRASQRRLATLRRQGFTEEEIAAMPPRPTRHNLDRRALAIMDAANQGTDDQLMTTPEVAVWLGVTEAWLEIGRSKNKGYGPPYIRLSPRRCRYKKGAVKAWLAERAYQCSTQYLDPQGTQFGRAVGSKVVDGKVVMPEPGDAT
jgi:predicted DNA-binding transcriptional regulator AlpA